MSVAEVVDRHLWYSYYLFQMALPLVLLWLACIIDKPDGQISSPTWYRAVAICSGLVFFLILTNDLHFLAFPLDPGNPNWTTDYGYGPVYYVSLAISFLSLLAGLGLLIVKSRGQIRKAGLLLPFAFILLLAAYCYGYVHRIPIAWESDLTMVVAVFAFFVYETIIRIGLIPVNSRYAAFFSHSPLGIQITDRSGAIALQAATAATYALHADTFAAALASSPSPVQFDEDTLLFVSGVTGGYMLWYEDISDLNRLHRDMEESVRNLEVANLVLAEEEKIRRALDAENARTQLMSQLETEITNHTVRLSTMIEQLEMVMDKPKATARIMLLLCYLKRRCNLFFREREATVLPRGELTLYLDEMAEIAAFSPVQVIVADSLTWDIPVRFATLLYDFFYNVVYWATWLDDLRILVFLASEGGRILLRMLPSEDAHSFRMDRGLEASIATAGGLYEVKDIDDDAVGFVLSFPGGGDEIV